MLTKIETKNYRNLDLEDGVTLGALNIFVGPNGSGKTNLIRVLKFIQDGLIGAPDLRRGVSSFESAIADFGSGRILDASVASPADVCLRLELAIERDLGLIYELELNVTDGNAVTIRKESLAEMPAPASDKTPDYYFHVDDSQARIASIKSEVNGQKSELRISGVPSNKFFLKDLKGVRHFEAKEHDGRDHDLSDVYYFVDRLQDEITQWSFYESARMDIETIRHPKLEIGAIDQTLNPSGDNLIPVLNNLFRDHIDFEERILDAIQELFPQTRRLRVVAEGRTLAIQWFVNGIAEPFYIDQMSTGTIRMLCWATVLLSPKKHELIVIEEPENDLHPAWLRILAGWIRQAAREVQVIVSTHSSDLLDYFTDDAESLLVFKRSPNNRRNSIIKPLDRDALAPRLQEGWQLGDLYRVHDPSVGGWPW